MEKISVLYDETIIAKRVRELGREITAFYGNKQTVRAVSVMNGALFFTADLLRAIEVPTELDTISVSSYEGDHSTGKLNIRSHLKMNTQGAHVLLIDDILDTGLTLMKTVEYLKEQGAADVRTCVLLNKILPEGRTKYLKADWSGFSFPPKFVVGYGLDYNEKYRSLPYIGYLE